MLLYFILGLLVGILISITYYIMFTYTDKKLLKKNSDNDEK